MGNRHRYYTPITSAEAIAERVDDPNFIPRIWPNMGGTQDWFTMTMTAVEKTGGIARTSQIIAMLRQRENLPVYVLQWLRRKGLVTVSEPRWTGWHVERWIALDERHPCMPEIRGVLRVTAKRLRLPPVQDKKILEPPVPPYEHARVIDMGTFFGAASRTRLIALLARLAPITIYDLARFGDVAVRQGHRTVYQLAQAGLVSMFHSRDERHRVWVTLNRDAEYGDALAALARRVATFQSLPFAAFKESNDAYIARLVGEKSRSQPLLDRLIARERILDT